MTCFASLPLLRSLAILDQEQYRPKLAADSVFRKRCSAAVRTLAALTGHSRNLIGTKTGTHELLIG
jgi:hypothetical protein